MKGFAMLLILWTGIAGAQTFQRYYETTSVRVGGRVIAVGDTVEQLRRNRPSRVNGNTWVFTDGRVTARCHVGGPRNNCVRLSVERKR